MISNTQFWNDITQQVDEWLDNKMVGNAGTRYQTGYGGPKKGNEAITLLDFQTLKFEWREYCKEKKLDCNIAYSGSGREDEIQDFLCNPYNNPKLVFVYHIRVPGSYDPRNN
jgi:hypothetical protein